MAMKHMAELVPTPGPLGVCCSHGKSTRVGGHLGKSHTVIFTPTPVIFNTFFTVVGNPARLTGSRGADAGRERCGEVNLTGNP